MVGGFGTPDAVSDGSVVLVRSTRTEDFDKVSKVHDCSAS